MAPPITREETGFGPGETGASAPRVPGIPTFSANGSGSITITAPASNGNDAVVTYSIRATYAGPTIRYVQADGTLGVGEVFRTLAAWGSTVTVTGLTDFVAYTFASRSRNQLSVDSAWTSESAVMNTRPDIDWGALSGNLAREITGGNTIVDETVGLVITGNEVAAAEESQTTTTEYYGPITVTYRLKNNYAATSSVVVQFNETYVSPGTPGTWVAATASGGDGTTSLATSATGKQHVYIWDSYSDSGTSELDASVYLRIIPYDAAATGSGSAAASLMSSVFGVNNRPAQITWVNDDGYTFDKDTTPVFRGVMPSLRGGTKGFPLISIYRTSGLALVASHNSVVSVVGWEYESGPATWNALTTAGIPSSAIDGVNQVRYTVQAALDTDDYTVNGRMGETRDWG